MLNSSRRACRDETRFRDGVTGRLQIIYTTNAIEALNSSLRKLLQYRGHFPNDESITKILNLALARYEKKWRRCLRNWSAVLGQFAIFFEGRTPAL